MDNKKIKIMLGKVKVKECPAGLENSPAVVEPRERTRIRKNTIVKI